MENRKYEKGGGSPHHPDMAGGKGPQRGLMTECMRVSPTLQVPNPPAPCCQAPACPLREEMESELL